MNDLKKKYNKEVLKEKNEQLSKITTKGKFISLHEYLVEKANIIEEQNLDQHKDYYELEIKTIEKLIRKIGEK